MEKKRKVFVKKVDEELIKDCCRVTGLSREEVIENIKTLEKLNLINVGGRN